MSLLDGQVAKPTLGERVTLHGLLLTFGVTFAVTSIAFVVLMLVGFAFFTAKDSDVPWLEPINMLDVALWLFSGIGLLGTLLAVGIQRDQEDR